jgi:hypothetical protein
MYQNMGFDRGYPAVLPANTFVGNDSCAFICPSPDQTDNNAWLKRTVDSLKARTYLVALHENYRDYYLDDYSVECAKDPNGFIRLAYFNDTCDAQSYIARPSYVTGFADFYSNGIKNTVHPSWSYLDVHSGVSPNDGVDYNSALEGAGSFHYVLTKYRYLPTVLRKYGGPVQGEGGQHMYYVGYFDDFDARIQTTDYHLYGAKAPLLLDFDISKLRPQSAMHGVGQYYIFFAPSWNIWFEEALSVDKIYTYIATELAYGHAGFLIRSVHGDHLTYHASLERISQKVISAINKAGSSVPTIEYFDVSSSTFRNASDYIDKHPHYDSLGHAEFMGRVRVTYSNGVVVWVNRSSSIWSVSSIPSGGWYFWHISSSPYVGSGYAMPPTNRLSSVNGWMCHVPPGLMAKSATEDLHKTTNRGLFALDKTYPNPFNPKTVIHYSLPFDVHAVLKIYSIVGQTVATLVDEEQSGGWHTLTFDGSRFATGVYILSLQAGSNMTSQKILLLK